LLLQKALWSQRSPRIFIVVGIRYDLGKASLVIAVLLSANGVMVLPSLSTGWESQDAGLVGQRRSRPAPFPRRRWHATRFAAETLGARTRPILWAATERLTGKRRLQERPLRPVGRLAGKTGRRCRLDEAPPPPQSRCWKPATDADGRL
jgi:hypothetical protein